MIWVPTNFPPLDWSANMIPVWQAFPFGATNPISEMYLKIGCPSDAKFSDAKITLVKANSASWLQPKLYKANLANVRKFGCWLDESYGFAIGQPMQHGVRHDEDYHNPSYNEFHEFRQLTFGGFLWLKVNVYLSSGWGDPEDVKVPNYCGIGPNNIARWRDGLWYIKGNPPPPSPPPTPAITCYPDGTTLPF